MEGWANQQHKQPKPISGCVYEVQVLLLAKSANVVTYAMRERSLRSRIQR